MREIQDAGLKTTFALPNAANTVNSNILDLGSVTPYPITEAIGLRITNTIATGANSKNINIVIQHSADTNVSNFTNIPELAVKVIAGNAANIIPNSLNVQLPQSTKRYIRATATGEATGGNSADGTATVAILF